MLQILLQHCVCAVPASTMPRWLCTCWLIVLNSTCSIRTQPASTEQKPGEASSPSAATCAWPSRPGLHHASLALHQLEQHVEHHLQRGKL